MITLKRSSTMLIILEKDIFYLGHHQKVGHELAHCKSQPFEHQLRISLCFVYSE